MDKLILLLLSLVLVLLLGFLSQLTHRVGVLETSISAVLEAQTIQTRTELELMSRLDRVDARLEHRR